EVDDDVAADGDESGAPLRPERGDGVGGASAPVVPAEDGIGNVQRVHERDRVVRERGLLAVADGVGRPEPGGSEAAKVGHDDPEALGGQYRGDVGVAVDVVGPDVEQDDGLAVGRACFGVPDVEVAGVDLFDRAELV